MDLLIEIFIDFPMSLFSVEFDIFGYKITLLQIFIFGILAMIAGRIIYNLFDG